MNIVNEVHHGPNSTSKARLGDEDCPRSYKETKAQTPYRCGILIHQSHSKTGHLEHQET